jgi:hypothetical protein
MKLTRNSGPQRDSWNCVVSSPFRKKKFGLIWESNCRLPATKLPALTTELVSGGVQQGDTRKSMMMTWMMNQSALLFEIVIPGIQFFVSIRLRRSIFNSVCSIFK